MGYEKLNKIKTDSQDLSPTASKHHETEASTDKVCFRGKSGVVRWV